THALAVTGHRLAIGHLRGRPLAKPRLRKAALLAAVAERLAEPEDVEAQIPHAPVSLGMLEAEPARWDLPQHALIGGQDGVGLLPQLLRGEALSGIVSDADQVGEGLGIPSMNGALPQDGGGIARNSSLREVVPALRRALKIDTLEGDTP